MSIKKIHISLICILAGFLMPMPSYAATLLFSAMPSTTVGINEMFKVNVLIDPQGQTINGVESTIQYPSDIVCLVRIEDGDSFIPLWLQPPTQDQDSVYASGVVPQGFNGTINVLDYPKLYPGTLMTLVFEPLKSGQGLISTTQSQVLLNDGVGTPAQLTIQPLTITVTNDTVSNSIISDDTTPPNFIVAEVSYQPMIGGRVLIFMATDKESGIDHYEIQENGRWVPVTSPYRISDNPSTIAIKAVDRAGNEQIKIVDVPIIPDASSWYFAHIFIISSIGTCIMIMILVVWIWRRRKNNIFKS